MNPLFICGSPRTGTTIMAAVLNSHPKISMTIENKIIWTMIQYISRLSFAHPVTDYEFGLNSKSLEEFNSTKEILYKYLRLAGGELTNKKPDSIYFGDKYPNLVFYLDVLWKLYPLSKIIIMTREKRKTINSILQKPWSKVCTKHQWELNYDFIEAVIDKNQFNKNVLKVNFEELQLNPEKTFQGIANWLEIENNFNLSLIARNKEELESKIKRIS